MVTRKYIPGRQASYRSRCQIILYLVWKESREGYRHLLWKRDYDCDLTKSVPKIHVSLRKTCPLSLLGGPEAVGPLLVAARCFSKISSLCASTDFVIYSYENL